MVSNALIIESSFCGCLQYLSPFKALTLTFLSCNNTIIIILSSLPFSEFMAPAVSSLEEVLSQVEIKKPRIPVISNVDAQPHSDPEMIKKLLATQVTSPVLWEKTMDLILSKDFEKAYELGPGKVTAGILKRFSKTAECTNIEV